MSTDEELSAIHSDKPEDVRDVLARRLTRESSHAALIALGLLYVGDRVAELTGAVWHQGEQRR